MREVNAKHCQIDDTHIFRQGKRYYITKWTNMERKKAIKKRAHTHEINVLLVIKQVTRVSGVPGGVGMTWHKLYHPYFGFI